MIRMYLLVNDRIPLVFRHELLLRDKSGPFFRDSAARATREENSARGMKTCWMCMQAFRRTTKSSDSAQGDRGQGRYFCSWAHYRAYEDETTRLYREVAKTYGVEWKGAAA